MAVKKTNQFDLDEIYRELRTNIEYSGVDDPVRVINVLSTFPKEGKSTVSQNLARILAAKYQNVLLIDCDLRSPSVYRRLMVSNQTGLTNILSTYDTNKSLHSYIGKGIQHIKAENGEEFSFISAGHRVPNPSELIGSKKFKALISKAKKEYSYVILDCPPMSITSDAVPLSNAADGTLYVVSAKDTDKRKAKAALNDLQRNGGNVLGIVLNKAEDAFSDGYGYGYKYGYGYGEYYSTDKTGGYRHSKHHKKK